MGRWRSVCTRLSGQVLATAAKPAACVSGPNEQKSGIQIQLGKPAPVRRVKVHVTHADGRPAIDAIVNGEYPMVRFNVPVNEEGWAELQLLSGVPYEIRAEAGVRGTGRGRATIDATATEVTVVLNQ